MTAITAMNGGMVVIVFLKGWVAIIEDSFSRNHPTTVHGEEVTQTIPKLTYMFFFSWQLAVPFSFHSIGKLGG